MVKGNPLRVVRQVSTNTFVVRAVAWSGCDPDDVVEVVLTRDQLGAFVAEASGRLGWDFEVTYD